MRIESIGHIEELTRKYPVCRRTILPPDHGSSLKI
jgi:hypothetical protein